MFERLEHGLKPVSQRNCQKGALGNPRERNLRSSLKNGDASCLSAGRVGHGLRQIFKEPCVVCVGPTGAAAHIASGSVWATPQLTAKSPFLRSLKKCGASACLGRQGEGPDLRCRGDRPLIPAFSPEYGGEGGRFIIILDHCHSVAVARYPCAGC